MTCVETREKVEVSFSQPDGEGFYEPWVRLALKSPPWSAEKVCRARRLRDTALHLGEVAELLKCSVFEVQAELGIGRGRDVRAYRRIRGLDTAIVGQDALPLGVERAAAG